jgi:predicted nucleotidyltransferase
MWLFNGHVWALQRYGTNNKPDDIKKYLDDLQRRMLRYKSITGCAILGSMARGEFGYKSDIDIACTRNKGFISAVCAYSQGVLERTIAFLNRKPVELWFNNITNFQSLLDVEEPLIIKDSNGELAKLMPTAIPLNRYQFNNEFWKSTNTSKTSLPQKNSEYKIHS